MTRTRIALTTFVAFFVSQVMAVLIHGFVLAADYEPFDGTLLRSGGGRVAVHLPSRRASRVHLRAGMGLHAR